MNEANLARHRRILVIKLGALGDMVLCMRAFQAIQRAHPKANIGLLTSPPFATLARRCGYFDAVLEDPRAPKWDIGAWLDLRRHVSDFKPSRVYDLQGKTRQSILYYLLGGPLGKIEWSGAAPACPLARPWPPAPGIHYTDFVDGQLKLAGITDIGEPDLAWLDAPVDQFKLPKKFALLLPGSSLDHPYKRWPAANFAALAKKLEERGMQVVMAGARGDETQLAMIEHLAPGTVNLINKTDLMQLASIARKAALAVGNDTGPTHVAAAAGAPTLALFSEKVDPAWSAPRGKTVKWLQGNPIDTITVDQALAALPA
ncbi:MAG: ADP-heptose--LPS heptosyltransferase [Alphaproteobacteria bacterium]|nr:ADP-heptose--LPS heptosyltransferase [Alphaproteobacteria bacterium]